MTRTLMLAAAAAGLLGATTPDASAQSAGMALDPLRATVAGALRSRGMPSEDVAGMSLGQLATIKSLLDSSETDDQATLRIRTILQAQ